MQFDKANSYFRAGTGGWANGDSKFEIGVLKV
jgi:hypothetical protein